MLPHELWNRGQRDGWIESLDWVLEVLNDEIQFHENDGIMLDSAAVKSLDRIHRIVSHRRKEWMLSGEWWIQSWIR